LILDPKGDFLDKIQALCSKYGREDDLLILDPSSPAKSIRWNPFDSPDDELELGARFAAVLESAGMDLGDDSFWIDSARTFIAHAISLLRITNHPQEPPTMSQVRSLAASFKAISVRADRVAGDDKRGELCLQFFEEWVDYAPEMRTSIQALLTNMLDPFLREPYATAFSGRSTMSMADIVDNGKILYVHMPIADRERMSRTIGTFIKLAYYREVLKRPGKDRSSFFLCDEFQSFFTALPGKGDSDFFERSRQSRHANIIATQNVPALLNRAKTQHPVNSLLGNCAVKLFLRNTDQETNQYASGLCGETIVVLPGQNRGERHSKWQINSGSSDVANRQYDARYRPEVFTKLAVPSRTDGSSYCETILHLSSRTEIMDAKLKWKLHALTS
jgi:type IV secretory pathway TraG/TraD family ATPase VirD4